jgi:uncharacterized damage-inducible protein DinB
MEKGLQPTHNNRHSMKAFFKDIFDYHHNINLKIIDQLIEHQNELNEQLTDRLYHSINAHQIWNAIIQDTERWDIQRKYPLEESKQVDLNNYLETINIIESRDLDEVITYTNYLGKEYKNSIQAILYHVGNHFSHHRGQIASDLRKLGIDPVRSDYIAYKR